MKEINIKKPSNEPFKEKTDKYSDAEPLGDDYLTFTCNICGKRSTDLKSAIESREHPSCIHCKSNLRFRALIHAFSSTMFNHSYILTAIPKNKKIKGIGMSDWEGYAGPLANIFSYTNTFYHQEPKLDICNIQDKDKSKYDFLISSDVLEHIPPPVEIGFKNMFELLKPGGICVLTVPFKKEGETEEHFPELHQFYIKQNILFNTTTNGKKQTFDNLVFHGGDGSTLEMRFFSENDLIKEMEKAGFENIKIHTENHPEYGITWPMTWAVPVTANRPLGTRKGGFLDKMASFKNMFTGRN